MDNFSEPARRALLSDCAHSIEPFVRDPARSDIDGLSEIVRRGSDAGSHVRQRAIYLLGRVGGEAAIPPIVAALPEFTLRERIAAADALGLQTGEVAEKAALTLSEDPDAEVRSFAARALARLGGDAATRRLRVLVRDDDAPMVREVARGLMAREGR